MVPQPPKISIFWHPKTPRKQLSSEAAAKMPRYQPTWCQDNPAGAKIAAAAGAKMPRYQPSWCQDIKIPSRARPSGPLTPISLGCPETIKSTILLPESQHVNMSRKHII